MPKCRDADCKVKHANFNFPSEKQGICCAKHKEDDMIDIYHKKCIYNCCNILPCFNYNGKISPLYCVQHKLENMIDIKNKKCIFEGCKIKPNYNYINQKKPIYCSIHKLENMINVVNKTCMFKDCKTIPCYNFENEIKPLYCNLHKLDKMINIKDKKCIYEGCNIIPYYNFENEIKPLYCNNHKLENMINIKNKKCIYEGCNIIPCYNFENEIKPLYCNNHKLKNMINVISKICKSSNCKTRVSNPKYQGYCTRCFMYTFPDEPVARNYKIKEKHVTDFVNIHFGEYVESYDKQIQGGCSKRRPDIFIDLFTHTIIIEIDEDNHNNYDTICENKRIMELFEDLANRPIVLIRFNPDKYTNDKGNTIKSCFKYHKISGVPIVENEAEWNNRLEKLKNTISKYILSIPEKEVTIEYLFYSH